MVILRAIFISVILVVLTIGGVLPALESKDFRISRGRLERRPLAKFPDLTRENAFWAFPSGFDLWIKDHFGFRDSLISIHSYLHHRLLGDMPNNRYIRGKNGWYFRAVGKKRGAIDREEYFNDLLDIAGRAPLTERELKNWDDRIGRRKNTIKSRGGTYLFTIGPRKSTIYPELLPDKISQHRSRTRLDQLMERLLIKHSDAVIDLAPALFQAKNRKDYHKLYYQTDTHWTYYGAYFAYQEFMQRLATQLNRPELNPVPLSSFNISERAGWFHTGFFAETRIRQREGFVSLVPKIDSEYSKVNVMRIGGGFVEAGDDDLLAESKVPLTEIGIGDSDMEIHTLRFLNRPESRRCRFVRNEAQGLPIKNLILLGDSFLQMAALYFSAHAERTYLCRQTKELTLPIFDETIGKEISSEVVLQELTESYIGRE